MNNKEITAFQESVKEKYKQLLLEQKDFFNKTHKDMTVDNHLVHFTNPDYWNILLSDVRNDPDRWEDKIALDFGCGCGRNMKTLLELADWERVDGCDISEENAQYAEQYVNALFPNKTRAWGTDGCTIADKENEYDFIMSTITLQHIPCYDIRLSILMDMFRLLKPGGLLSIQFADMTNSQEYYVNMEEFFINKMNCCVKDVQFIIKDLEEIGFKIIEHCMNTKVFHAPWYFIKATKE